MAFETLAEANKREWHDNPHESIMELLDELLGYTPDYFIEKWNLAEEVEWAKVCIEHARIVTPDT